MPSMDTAVPALIPAAFSHLLFLSLLLLFNSLFPDLFKPLTQWLSLFLSSKSQKGDLTTENFINIVMIMTSLLSEIPDPLFIRGGGHAKTSVDCC